MRAPPFTSHRPHRPHSPDEALELLAADEIENALSPFGARITSQYLPPTTILDVAGVNPGA